MTAAVNGRLYVRCCCQPTKILGTLPNTNGRSYTEKYHKLCSDPLRDAQPVLVSEEISVTVYKDVYYDERGRPELAYKADGIDLDTLRKLRNFQPNIDGNADTAANRPSAPRARESAASDGDFACPAVDPELARMNHFVDAMVQRHIDIHRIDIFDV